MKQSIRILSVWITAFSYFALLEPGASQSVQRERRKIEADSEYLPAELKKEYRDFMRALKKTKKFNEKIMVRALKLERHLQEDARYALALKVKDVVHEKFYSNSSKDDFALFRGCRSNRITDAFFYTRSINRRPFQERQTLIKKIIIEALDRGADINFRKGYTVSGQDNNFISYEYHVGGKTALMLAAQAGYLNIVRYLLEHGALKSIRDDLHAKTAYDYAQIQPEDSEEVRKNKLIIQKLVYYDSTFEKEVEQSMKALNERGTSVPKVLERIISDYVVGKVMPKATPESEEKEREEKSQEISSALSPQSSQPHLTKQQQDRTNAALFATILQPNPVMSVDELLDKHAQLDARDSDGRTPLMVAIIANRTGAVDSLLARIQRERNSSEILGMVDHQGQTALSWAQHYKRTPMIAKLVAAGAPE